MLGGKPLFLDQVELAPEDQTRTEVKDKQVDLWSTNSRPYCRNSQQELKIPSKVES